MNAITILQPYQHAGMWVFDDPDKRLAARAGALTVYWEGGLLALVHLRSVQANTEGVGAEVVLVQRLACEHKGYYVRKRWDIWSVWDYFREESDSWYSSIVGWHLDFNRMLIAELSDFCAKLPARLSAEVRWQTVHEFIADADPTRAGGASRRAAREAGVCLDVR